MDIYTRKHATQGIPIVPMLDILTILLIFFIVHTEFKRQASVLKLSLPQTHHLSGEKADSDSLLLEVGAGDELALGGKTIPAGDLQKEVRQILQGNPDTRIQVSAAEGASMGRFIETLDHLQAAGIQAEEVPIRIRYHADKDPLSDRPAGAAPPSP